uniref:Gamma-secretase subunit PEN-2 n=1 Tax=Hemiselmis andersenii TaxID=464988 RepID=A0A6U5A932_HEMAN
MPPPPPDEANPLPHAHSAPLTTLSPTIPAPAPATTPPLSNRITQQLPPPLRQYAQRGISYLTDAPSPDVLVARQMFTIGFLGLPLFWLLNILNFNAACTLPSAPPELKTLVRHCRIAFGVSVFAVVCYFLYFQWYGKDSWACYCGLPFSGERECHCAIGDDRPMSKGCVRPEGSCPAAERSGA